MFFLKKIRRASTVISSILTALIVISHVSLPVYATSPSLQSSHSGKCTSDLRITKVLPEMIELGKTATTVQSLKEALVGKHGDITINQIQVFEGPSSSLKPKEIERGSTSSNMTVKAYYDNGKSWVTYGINHSFGTATFDYHSSNISRNQGPYGFVLPVDEMIIPDSLTCRYGCEVNGILCDWCVANDKGFAGRLHYGLDISWNQVYGKNVRAVSSGVAIHGVEYPNGLDNPPSDLGNWVMITHDNGLSTRYLHLATTPTALGYIPQGTIIGSVGDSGMAEGAHLHFDVYRADGVRIDPYFYLEFAPHYSPVGHGPCNYIIVDGPLHLRSEASSSSAALGSLQNGTSLTISKVVSAADGYLFGYISAGEHIGKWIAVGHIGGETYAINLTKSWMVYDGPLNIRELPSQFSFSYGTITNRSYFWITEITVSENYVWGKITGSPIPILFSGSTCTMDDMEDHWVILDYCTTYHY